MARERRGRRALRSLARDIVQAFQEHRLLTHASAVSFRAVVALIPLVLLGLGILGALGLEDVWTDSIAPSVRKEATLPVFEAIDFSVRKIFSTSPGPLIAFAAALALWHLAGAVGVITQALNAVHDVEDDRPFWKRVAVSVALAATSGACLVGAVLVVLAGPRLAEGGALNVVLGLGRWLAAVLLLGLAVGVLVRYAPAEHPQPRWASAGSVAVIAAWILVSLAFRWWAGSVADFKSAVGVLAALLVLSAYLFTSVIVFLAGVQLDEFLRKRTGGEAKSVVALLRGQSSRR